MSSCTKYTKQTEVVQYVDVATYVLSLSEEEAQALAALCGKIGGDPKTTWRGKLSNIHHALLKVGIVYDKNTMKATVSGARTGEQPGNFAIFAHGDMKNETC